jgi:RimJ/RimL family protein N-acetyltransferase
MTVAHARRVFEGMQDPEVHRYVPHEPPRSVEDLETLFHKRITGPNDPGRRWFNWIAVVRTSGDAIGNVQITTLPDRTALLGYFLLRPWWRQGYGREACAAVIEWLRRGDLADTLVAEVDSRNVASIALLESLGFTRAGVTKSADFFKGEPSDEFHYELALVSRVRGSLTDSAVDFRSDRGARSAE